ncbi:penicillin-binding protein 1B [Sulfuriflexus mobilis]|uniref:penicillin-binding protein 1B n=1 Tax=Sulfuriflexus mobilis TaxID=1811807 RepID=UPI000F832389|nr:penicillin-binding protein 1B [Sulfuriflexus mobilis]
MRGLLWRAFGLLLLGGLGYTLYLDFTIRQQFEGKRWELPARVYARPLELYSGQSLSSKELVRELKAVGYQPRSRPEHPGSYRQTDNTLSLITRSFDFWDGSEPSRRLSLRFEGQQLVSLHEQDSGAVLDIVRLEPVLMGGIYPRHNEDRLLVQLDEVPSLLIKSLLSVEDRDFYQHHGIAPRAIARAMWANLRAGHTVQGGSTLTQQLVKNFFLSQERSLSRKLNEALMSLLVEWHYDKDEILEAYLNEVYLGQSGQRGIHGFGLASRYYFGRHISELDLPQMALLVAIVKGPSYYDPRRHPQRARERRNLVLSLMQEQGFIDNTAYNKAVRSKLVVIPKPRTTTNDYPAYLELVKRQLRRDYRDEDLRSEGLQIFTSFDPNVQWQAERALTRRIQALEEQRRLPKSALQGAAIITAIDNGEVLAVVGDRAPRASGFNRALDAVRPIGSLMKPAVYLSALEQHDKFTLASLLDDSYLLMTEQNGEQWQPANYDKLYHGKVLLQDALVHSYNVSTVRLGQVVGLDTIAANLKRLGIFREVHRYPSLPLGTVALSPVEVAQMYQVFAAGGFYSPLRSIREVLDAKGKPLQRYPLTVKQAFKPADVYLLNHGLRAVVEEGTAAGLMSRLPAGLVVAGKTGTTDDLRDSWFAGFSGAHMAVVWMGMDDNKSAGLTGASGAMLAWADMMKGIRTQALWQVAPESIETLWIDRASGLLGNEGCEQTVRIPFIKGTAPTSYADCAGGGFADTLRGVFGIFGK